MKQLFIMSLFSALLGIFSCNAQNAKFKSVNPQEFAKVISDTTVVRLDVRTAEEYADGHIDGAINIDVLKNDFLSKATAKIPKKSTVALYCRSGNRSKRAANMLSAKGYKVIELNTGYIGWLKK